MSIPRQYAADTPIWYDRRMPTLEDFDGNQAAFDQAFAEYVNQINGPQLSDTPNFGIPEQQVTTFNPDGTTSTATRGGLPARFEGMSQSELAANQLNARFDNIAKKQNAGMYSPEQRKMDLLALNSRAQVRPEEMQGAYNAVRADGSPVLADPVLAYLEQQFGYAPGDNANFTPPAQEAVDANGFLPSPFDPAATWTVRPDGTMVNGNGEVWVPGQGTLLPGSNPMMVQEAAQSGQSPQDILAAIIASGNLPGDPGFTLDGSIQDLGFDPATFADTGGAMTEEQVLQALAALGLTDPSFASNMANRLRLQQLLGGY